MKHLVVSHETSRGIVAIEHDIEIANWIANSLSDANVKSVSPWSCNQYHTLTYDWVVNHDAYVGRNNDIALLDNAPARFAETKFLALQRQALFRKLYAWTTDLKAKTHSFATDDFPELAQRAVDASDPAHNKWHHWILDYATLHDAEPIIAYQNLKMIAECEAEFRFKINALALKWIDKINATTIDDFRSPEFAPNFLLSVRVDYWLLKEI